MATKPYSRLKGDAYRAYEELPPEVRRALQESLVDWCPLRAREWLQHLLRQEGMRPAQASFFLVQTIRRQDHAEVAAFARTWPKGAEAYPHLAAGATLQRYTGTEGIPAAQAVQLPPPARRAKAAKPAAKSKVRGTKPAMKRKAARRKRR